MIDFWEAFGRIVTTPAFCAGAYAAVNPTTYPTQPFRGITNLGLNIPKADYDSMRTVVALYITDGPVSMMALGELVMIMTNHRFRGLNDALIAAIQANGATILGLSKLYYTALGCMLLDSSVRAAFQNGGINFGAYGYGGLSGAEQTSLTKLALDAHVVTTAKNACNLFWQYDCGDLQTFYPGHLHPFVQPYPPAA